MGYSKKSKADLINELKELQQNYNSLKELYDADINERKQIEEKLRVNEERLRLTLNVTQIGIWDWNLKDDSWYTSPIYYTMLGYEPVSHKSDRKIWLERIHPEDRKAVSEKINKILRRESNEYSYEARMKHANGSYRWHSVIGHVIEWDNGEPTRLIGVRIDITERKDAEKALILAKEKAIESDRLKTAFLQNMSHEIRTPMNAIMGFSDLLIANYNNKDKLEKFSEIITQRCNDLLEIIDDILNIAKIESGQLYVNNEECNLNELFAELSSFFIEYKNRLDKQQIEFSLQALCDPSDRIIITDKVKLKQIFINLISNAFKFTEEGKIEGGCRFDENNKLLFYVSDTGIGIPADQQELIFERFIQLSRCHKKNIGGTGLGLSIVKGLVKLLGGEIFLESEPDKGSTFSFSLPYKITPLSKYKPKEIEEFSDKSLISKNILVVEDDFYNSEYLKEILSGVGIHVLQAEDGKEAVEIALSHPIDLILLDIRLPDMNGYDVLRQIRQYKPYLKIIAQTAYAAQDERQKALDAGCCDYISKPTKQDVLLSMLNKHLL